MTITHVVLHHSRLSRISTFVYAVYSAYYSDYAINPTNGECNCSNNYATLFHPEFTDFDSRLFRLKLVWALPVVMNYTTDPTGVGTDIELIHKIMESPHYACTTDQTSNFVRVPEVPGYRCKCRDGFIGDGYTNGTGCTSKNKHKLYLYLHIFNIIIIVIFHS